MATFKNHKNLTPLPLTPQQKGGKKEEGGKGREGGGTVL